MKYGTLVALMIVFFTACEDDDKVNRLNQSEDCLIFGTFYGFCAGEQCIEIFALQEGKLFEDQNDKYLNTGMQPDFGFEQLSDDKFEIARDMFKSIPAELLATESKTFGCPDCADGGGVFLEIRTPSCTRMFFIDNDKDNIPEYLHPLVDRVREKVDLLQ